MAEDVSSSLTDTSWGWGAKAEDGAVVDTNDDEMLGVQRSSPQLESDSLAPHGHMDGTGRSQAVDSPEPILLKSGSFAQNTKKVLDTHPPWTKRLFGIGPEDRDSGMPKSNLIVPLSPFGVGWIGVTSLFLAYTAVFTPPMIALFWLEDPCTPIPTLWFDVIVDSFFIIDIILSFHTGVYIEGEYIDNRRAVAEEYLKGFFVFDLITSVPVSFIELAAVAECGKASSDVEFSVESEQLRFARAIKPLRYVKIAKILRLGKGGGLVASLMDHWSISPKMSKTVQVLVTLLMSIHIIACSFWLWKVIGAEASGNGQKLIDEFLDSQPFIGDRADLSTSWGKMEAYIISIYVTTMTLTTVGYGDISASNTAERLGYVVLFIVSSFVWGELLSDVAEIHQTSSMREKEKSDRIQSTLDFLIENNCPRHLRTSIIQWTRFHEDHEDESELKKQMINDLPSALQKRLVKHLYAREVSRLPLFSYIERVDDGNQQNDAIQESFLNEIFLLLKYATFTPGEVLVNFSEPADDMFIFESGKVLVEFEHTKRVWPSMTLKEGDFIGDMALVNELNWAKSTCFNFPPNEVDDDKEYTEIRVTPFQDSYVVALTLSTEKFQETLKNGSPVTVAAVEEFHTKWRKQREAMSEDPANVYKMEQLHAWEMMASAFKKKIRQDAAVHENQQWKIAKVQKSKKDLTAIEQQVLETTAKGDKQMQTLQESMIALDKRVSSQLEQVQLSQAALMDLMKTLVETPAKLPGQPSADDCS